jgi:hypothetical protein
VAFKVSKNDDDTAIQTRIPPDIAKFMFNALLGGRWAYRSPLD